MGTFRIFETAKIGQTSRCPTAAAMLVWRSFLWSIAVTRTNAFPLSALCVILTWLICSSGCGRVKEQPDTTGAQVRDAADAAHEPEQETPRRSAWTPDPKLVDQLKLRDEVGDYQLLLPSEFEALQIDFVPDKFINQGILLGNTEISCWFNYETGKHEPEGFIEVIVSADPKVVSQANKDMVQSLEDFSAGFTQGGRIRISSRQKMETGTVNGIEFSRFKWSGSTTQPDHAHGLVCGAIDNGQVIAILAMTSGPSAEADIRLLETSIATFKKR
jgi:hypothetical protein